jgi:poly(3-hydroxybutyrate) depolymerase
VSAVAVTWPTKKRTLGDGRTYFVRAPVCTPAGSAYCKDFLQRERAVVFFLHGATGAEDRETASGWLGGLHALSPDTIFVFGVSKDGSQRWDAGFCCTPEPVDDIGYLERVTKSIARSWTVDLRRVGAMGLSNGGMLALRVACERPDLIATVAALAATFDGSCDAGRVRIGQWHGASDTTVPLDGGTSTVGDTSTTFPPVASLAERMAKRSMFQLRVLPGRGHAMSWAEFKAATRWLLAHLPTD